MLQDWFYTQGWMSSILENINLTVVLKILNFVVKWRVKSHVDRAFHNAELSPADNARLLWPCMSLWEHGDGWHGT